MGKVLNIGFWEISMQVLLINQKDMTGNDAG